MDKSTKSMFESTTIQGNMLGLAVLVMGAVGYNVTPEDMHNAVLSASAVGASISNLISIWGRVKASKRIK